MRINKLKIQSFGKLQDVNITLDDKITVIQAKNEAGKSTIASFVRYMLYGFGQGARKNLADNLKKHYTPWEGDTVSGELDFTADNGNRFTAVRKNSARSQSTVLDEQGAPLMGVESAGEYFLGLDEPVYKKTAFVGQSDVAFEDDGGIEKAINNIVNSGSEDSDVTAALDKLTKLKKELLGMRGASGKIYALECQLNELFETKQRLQNGHSELLTSESRLTEVKEKIKANDEKISALEKELFNFKCIEASQKLDEVNALKQKALQSKAEFEAYYKSALKGAFMPNEAFCEELEQAMSALTQNESKLSSAKQGAADAKAKYDSAYSNEAQKRISGRLSELKITDLEAAELLEHMQKKRSSTFTVALVLTLLIVTLPIAIIFWVKHSKIKKQLCDFVSSFGTDSAEELSNALKANKIFKEATRAVRELYDSAVSVYQGASCDLEQSKTALQKLLETAQVSVAHEDSLYDVAYGLHSDISAWLSEVQRLKGICNEDYIRYSTLSQSLDLAELGSLSEKVDSGIALRDKKQVELEMRYCTMQNKELSDLERELEKKTAVLAQTVAKPAELESRIYALQQEKELLTQKHEQLELAIQALSQAGETMQKSLSPKISADAAQIFSVATKGKYRGLYTNSEMQLTFLESNSAAIRPAGFLSTGTLELAYISLRLSLCQHLYKENPTLIFDDAFTHMDDERLRAVTELLYKLSDRFQIVIMTCHDREAKLLQGKAKIIDFAI